MGFQVDGVLLRAGSWVIYVSAGRNQDSWGHHNVRVVGPSRRKREEVKKEKLRGKYQVWV